MRAAADVEHQTVTAEWEVWTTTARLVVTEPAALAAAVEIVRDYLSQVDAAASRFRPDSEVCRLAVAIDGRTTPSPLLRELVHAALWAAQTTDGAVDPTLGSVLTSLGYRGDLDQQATARRAAPTLTRRATWRDVHLDPVSLQVPPATLLDLGATAKAYAADRSATIVAETLDCGALVSLGGDIRFAGREPAGGWRVRVQDGPDQPASTIRLTGARAVATSSTLHRRWLQDEEILHHVLDPATGRPADPVWRTATVAANTCLEANTWSTAALVRGRRAPDLLRRAGVDARLVTAEGSVALFGGWPA